jgi:hypothetical protein
MAVLGYTEAARTDSEEALLLEWSRRHSLA